jgi:single-strand DNA-binding protein
MASYNKVVLVGNLTRDPDVRYTPKGMAVADIGLAVNRYYTADNGEKREETTFVDVTLWGRQAEVAGQYLKKGRPVLIEGRLQLDTWDDKQTGQKRSKLKVVGENLQLIGSPGGGRSEEGDGGGGGSGGGGEYEPREPRESRASSRPAPKGPPKPPADPDLDPPEEDDIPF